MKKTKIMSAIAVLAAAIPMTVSAAPQTTDINATVKSTYVLTIPAATSIIYGQESTDLKGSLKVSGNVDTNEKVKVSVATTPLHNDSHNEDIVIHLTMEMLFFRDRVVGSRTQIRADRKRERDPAFCRDH